MLPCPLWEIKFWSNALGLVFNVQYNTRTPHLCIQKRTQGLPVVELRLNGVLLWLRAWSSPPLCTALLPL